MLKKAKVVMLATNQKASPIIASDDKTFLCINAGVQNKEIKWNYQHLYLTTDEEIKERDWYIWLNNSQICQASFSLNILNNHMESGDIKKIIATTDQSLRIDSTIRESNPDSNEYGKVRFILPKPSDSFIAKYVESYNKGKVITDTMVEYMLASTNNSNVSNGYHLNIKSDNTIVLRPIKDSWSREEVIKLLELREESQMSRVGDFETLEEWIENNL